VLGLRLVVQAGTLLLVARMLGPEQFGAFAGIAALAVLLGTVSTFGMQLVLLEEMSKDILRRDRVLSYAIPTTLIFSISLVILYVFSLMWLFEYDGLSCSIYIKVGLSDLIISPLLVIMTTEHHAQGRVEKSQLLQWVPLALRMLFLLIVWKTSITLNLDIYSSVYLLSTIIAICISAWFLPKRWPRHQYWKLPNRSQWVKSFGYAVNNISKMGPSEVDKILSVKVLSAESTGVYIAAARVVGAITLPVTAMTMSALPRLFKESENQTFRSWRLLRWMYGFAFLYSLLLSVIIWLIAPILEMFFSDSYTGMGEIIRLLAFATPAIVIRLVGGNVLMAVGKGWRRVMFESFGVVILILSIFTLVPIIGLKGMVLSAIISEYSMSLLSILFVFRTVL
jgi:O-antigen/teichoic acid export membrane protein